MNATLAVSALLTYFTQGMTATKLVRDTTLAAMTTDLTEILHSRANSANGPCNAVTLSKADRKLLKMMWKRNDKRNWRIAENRNETMSWKSEPHSCYQSLVFHHGFDDAPRNSIQLMTLPEAL